MIEINDYKECCGCEACTNICPKNCISMEEHDGFFYPKINKEDCINCHLCEKICPVSQTVNTLEPIDAFAGYNNDTQSRLTSTSGGVFYLIAESIIRRGGTVYGVSFDGGFNTVFSRVEELKDLYKLQGSKYPQSRIHDTYKQIKSDLNCGKEVLFCGTPCQVNGLKLFLQKKYEKLYLIDLICHGVPSPVFWNKYLKAYFDNEVIKSVTFKDKQFGWKNWCVVIETDKRVLIEKKLDNAYMSSYLCGYNVRPSCFNCNCKDRNRASDITIGDAWGTPEKNKFLNDNQGMSSIIINTKKGEKIFEEVSNKMTVQKYSLDDVVVGNPAYHVSMNTNPFNKQFAHEMSTKDAMKTYSKYHVAKLPGKVIHKIVGLFNSWR